MEITLKFLNSRQRGKKMKEKIRVIVQWALQAVLYSIPIFIKVSRRDTCHFHTKKKQMSVSLTSLLKLLLLSLWLLLSTVLLFLSSPLLSSFLNLLPCSLFLVPCSFFLPLPSQWWATYRFLSPTQIPC